ncbi:alpha/beta fold hydrolase [Peribacillus acanthi]|uniref:alpha/beta fold hydrolase n=1 Tax=Peribacillus acanthi TaxID=2171554 RepID=UPI000D3EDA18|nr:alpha/beta fold hydrolase [Peribacillus acanthi]
MNNVPLVDERYLNVRGEEIYVKILGHGEPLVFLHGGPGGEHRYFLPHLEPLSEHYQLVFYDQRGCGNSKESSNKESYTMEEEVETLEGLRSKFGITKLNLIGESWGSMLALLYGCKYPDKVNKIFLTAAVGLKADDYLSFGSELENRLTSEEKVKINELVTALNKGEVDVKEIFKIIDKYYVYNHEALNWKTPTKSNADVNKHLGQDIIQNYDLTDKIHLLRDIPILIAQGEHDIKRPEKLKEGLCDYITQAQLAVISECGHWSVVEKPNELMKIIKEFFK